MKHYRFIHESPTHYILHDLRDRKHFNIAKSALSPDLHEKIKAIPLLGGAPIGDKESKQDMGMSAKYEDGGNIKPEKSFADKVADLFSPAKPGEDALPSEDARKKTEDSMRKAFGMAHGGNVQNYPTGGEVDEDLSEELKKRFKTPLPPPPREETQDEMYERIRKENHERAMGTRPFFAEGSPNITTRKSMAQRISSPIRVIDPITGQIKQSIEKTNSPLTTSGVADSAITELNSNQQEALKQILVNSEGRISPEEATKMIQAGYNPALELEPKILQQVGNDLADNPNKQAEVYQHYKKHGIDLGDPQVNEQVTNHMKQRGFIESDENIAAEPADKGSSLYSGGPVSPMQTFKQGNHTLHIYMGGELSGPKSSTGAPNIGSDEKVTREQMLKVNPDKGFDRGGQVTGSGTKMGTGFGDGNQKACPPFGKGPQHFDVGTPEIRLRPDTSEPSVQQEMLRLGVNAGLPGVTNTENISGADLSPYRQQAELKVAQDVDQSRKNEAAQATDRLNEQQMAHDKAIMDNELRVKAGFAPLEVPEAPPAPEIPAQQAAPIPPPSSRSTSPAMQMPDTLAEYQKAVGQQERGIRNEAAAKGQLAQEESALYNEHLVKEKARQLAYESEAHDLDAQNDKLFQAAQTAKLDPNRFWNEKSTGSKIATALAMIFGGALAGRTGQPNMAAQYLERQVANDLEAQKNDVSNKFNLYKMGLEKYKDKQSAEAFHNLQAYTMLQSQIKQAAAKVGGPQAQALADQAVGELESKKALLKPQLIQQGVQLKMMQDLQNGGAGPSPGNIIDNNRWTALRMTGLLKPEDEAAATKEAQRATEGESLRKSLTDSFNKLNTPGAGHLTPGLRDAEMQSLAGVLARVSEGRFNLQESKQQIEAIMPQLKDVLNPGIRQERLRKLNQLIDATVQTPTLDRFNLRRHPKQIQTAPPVIK